MMWMVYNRRPMKARERNVYVFRYVVSATREDTAIAKVKRELKAPRNREGKWSAVCVSWPVLELGCYAVDATDEDRASRGEL